MTAAYYGQAGTLEAKRLSGDEDALVDALRKVKGERSSRKKRADQVTQIMEETESPRVRNAAALALADMQFRPAGESIWRLLQRPGIGHEAGTLLYALEELGCKVPLRTLVNLLEGASYEARQGVLFLLQAGHVEHTRDIEGRSALEKLKRMGDSTDEELSEAARLALRYLAVLADDAVS